MIELVEEIKDLHTTGGTEEIEEEIVRITHIHQFIVLPKLAMLA